MAKYKPFLIEKGQNSVNTFIPYPSQFVVALQLLAGVANGFNIQADENGKRPKMAIFSYTADTFMQIDDDAEVPTINIIDGTASALNPSARAISKGTGRYSFISEVDAIVTIELYQ